VLSALLNWALLSFYVGKLVERMANHGLWLKALDEKVSRNERRIARLEGHAGLRD
jgi:hypothetical protein